MNKCGVEKHRLLFVHLVTYQKDTKQDKVGGKKMQKST